MYVVLSGAKKNAGDYFITESAERLLAEYRPDRPLFRLPAWESLEPHVDRINSSAAVIVLGGPGLQRDMYPKVYKFIDDLRRIEVPMALMGSGWKAFPGDEATQRGFEFSSQSLLALRKMAQSSPFLSCRDSISARLLKQHGIRNALVTGCPVWYDLSSIGKPMVLPRHPQRILFTPAQLPMYKDASIRIAEVLTRKFPSAHLACVFHRGITQRDTFTSRWEPDNNDLIERAVRALNYEVVDISGSGDGISLYGECDLHVGFRVHAHLSTLARRRPSLLLHEDGRGVAASMTLNVRGFDAFVRNFWSPTVGASRRLRKLVDQRLLGITADPALARRVEEYLDQLVLTRFAAYAGAGRVIDAHFEVMKHFLASLP
jgi:Polysaccharide pyruvyl transferase